jgi:hypothetical protein
MPLTSMWKGSGEAGLSLGKFLFGGSVRRIAAGATIGGVVGGIRNEDNSSTGMFRSIASGALAGAGIGALTSKTSLNIAKAAGRKIGTKQFGLSAYNVVKKMGRGGFSATKKVGRFAWNHPYAATALAGAGIGAYSFMSSGYSGSGMNANTMSQIAQQSGISSSGFEPGMGANTQQGERQMFMDSTFGLTQGLHKSRHRG